VMSNCDWLGNGRTEIAHAALDCSAGSEAGADHRYAESAIKRVSHRAVAVVFMILLAAFPAS
jgi:hypothetical protein